MNNPALDYGKIPPQAIDLEEVVLGALLLDPDVLDNVMSILPIGSFYKDSHNIIYESIRRVSGSGGAVDLLTVAEDIRKHEQLEVVGGVSYLASLTGRVASGAHSNQHALIILQKYVQREIIRIAGQLQEKAFDEGADADDLIAEAFHSINELQAMLVSNQRASTLQEALELSIESYFNRKKVRSSGQTTGIKTPLKTLDKYTSGFQNGDLIIVAARPSMGKTAFAITSVMNAAKQGKRPALFSIEMTTEKIADRIMIGEGQIDSGQYRTASLSSHDEQLLEKLIGDLAHLEAFIDDSPRQTVADIWGKCRILQNRGSCDFVVIDYVGLITPSKERGKSREQEVAEISSSLKAMAKDLNIPVMVLSQLNRGVESRPNKRPNLSDLRESGSLEQDADLVIMMYRDEYYNPGQNQGVGECIITKHRNGGVGTIEFQYNSSLTRIWEPENEGYVRPY